jgi:hypothetical protein
LSTCLRRPAVTWLLGLPDRWVTFFRAFGLRSNSCIISLGFGRSERTPLRSVPARASLIMKVQVVSYEDPDGWICGKIARRLVEGLNGMGHQSRLGRSVDLSADVNHHVIYLGYPGYAEGVHTLMITHIDDALKLRKLQQGLTTAQAGVCMSSETVARLGALGTDQSKLCYVNLAHDGKAKERRIQIGIATRLYPDGRKREADFIRLLQFISPADFAFQIMGFGWAQIVKGARALGFEMQYFEEFHYESYIDMISKLDYLLYLGEDEGSVSFIDALAAGVGTIVRPQGHHIDAKNGITYAFTNFEELKAAFHEIASIKHKRLEAVKNWTWENYARAHASIWERCLEGKPAEEIPTRRPKALQKDVGALRWALWKNAFLHRFRMVLNLRKDFQCESKLWRKRRANK